MTIDVDAEFPTAYTAALRSYLHGADEHALHAAYELGRRAVEDDLTVLELAAVHHDSVLAAVRTADDAADTERVMRAAGEFFLESLSAFEMVRRGFREAQDIALLERRHAAMVRQLSNFLADTSLALNTSDCVQEVLTLVVEQARELVGARCAMATVRLGPDDAPITATSFAGSESEWTELFARRATSSASTATGPTGDGSDEALRRLSSPITALDGRELGAIQLFHDSSGDFADLDEAVLAHVAQMASAAIERAELYENLR